MEYRARIHGSCILMPWTFVGLCCFYAYTGFILPTNSSSASSSGFLSSTGPSLLQSEKGCSLNFESMDYSVFSKCKGPDYPPRKCCEALEDFACPYADEINDMSNSCAYILFSYVNLYGNYPPGLIANKCTQGKNGLACNSTLSNSKKSAASKEFRNSYQTIIAAFRSI